MKTNELMELVNNGKAIPIVFNETIEDIEGRYEKGMKAYVVSASKEYNDTTIVFKTEEREFADYNKSIEQPVWLNSKTGTYDLKWSELDQKTTNADYEIWEESNADIFNFTILDENKMGLFIQYKSENNQISYVQWLENKVLELQNRL